MQNRYVLSSLCSLIRICIQYVFGSNLEVIRRETRYGFNRRVSVELRVEFCF